MSPVKPSSNEAEYFARVEAEKKRQLALQRIKETAEKERQQLQELHHMRCPKCGMELTEIAFHDVLVDKCFSCNGLWLDDGELEKVIAAGSGWSRMMRFFSRKEYTTEPENV